MGSSVTAGYADAIDQGICSLDMAVRAHLQSNCYPPLPVELVPACVKAIHNVQTGGSEKSVRLPACLKMRSGNGFSRTVPSWRLVDAAHLDAFINMEVD
jgi:hypothetical protein